MKGRRGDIGVGNVEDGFAASAGVKRRSHGSPTALSRVGALEPRADKHCQYKRYHGLVRTCLGGVRDACAVGLSGSDTRESLYRRGVVEAKRPCPSSQPALMQERALVGRMAVVSGRETANRSVPARPLAFDARLNWKKREKSLEVLAGVPD